ncbi:MAG: DUF3794 domain-containing protein [Ruminococcaceae bacterium]|nr:DUF3794 domain-containing protein [Oscillospiraceae bacterium]
MEIKLKKELLNTCELMFENTSEQSVDGDITLPDYCPDIKRILKCMVTPCLTSAQCVGDRVTIDANAFVQVIYVDDNNNIFCYDKTFPFSKTIELGKQIDNPVCDVKLKTAYANTRAVSQRRIDIHASAGVSIRITCKKEVELISDAENCGIQLLKNFDSASDFIGQTVKDFTLNEVMEIGKSKAPVRQIIRQKATPIVSEIKVIANKLLIKGEASVSILYCKDNSDGGYETYENSMPVSQIIELDGIEETSDYSAKLSVSSLNIIPKADSSGEKRLFDVTAVISAVIKADKKVDSLFPSDCYSTLYNVKCEKKLVTFEKIIQNTDELIMVKKSEEFLNISVKEIISVWCDDVVTTYTCAGDELKIIGSTMVSVLAVDTSGQPFYAERNVSFEKVKNIEGGCKNLICNADAIVSAAGFVLSDSNKIDLRVEMRLHTSLSRKTTGEILTDIQCDTAEVKEKKYSVLTIYFPDDGELLWNIARKFGTTVDAIKSENEINNSTVSEKCMLLIPGV